jgi:Ni/Fe-hydrogenase subunit HybB-like protein
MQSFSKKCKEVWNSITIEPVFFFFALAHGFYIIISKTLYISKVCNVNLNYSAEICDNIQGSILQNSFSAQDFSDKF